MIKFYKEGDTINNGFNVYRLSNKSSFGFIFRYGSKVPLTTLGSKVFFFRYSKSSKKWTIRTIVNPNSLFN